MLIGEIAMPAQAVTALASTITQPQVFQLPVDGYSLPANYRIYAGNTVAVGNPLAFQISVTGGDY
jgi:hypothetical protein